MTDEGFNQNVILKENMNKDLQNSKWHLLSYQNVLGILNTSSKGLSTAEVNIRQKESGPNILRGQKGESAFTIFIRQFLNPISLVSLKNS